MIISRWFWKVLVPGHPLRIHWRFNEIVRCSDFGSLYSGITVGDHFATSLKKSSTLRKNPLNGWKRRPNILETLQNFCSFIPPSSTTGWQITSCLIQFVRFPKIIFVEPLWKFEFELFESKISTNLHVLEPLVFSRKLFRTSFLESTDYKIVIFNSPNQTLCSIQLLWRLKIF